MILHQIPRYTLITNFYNIVEDIFQIESDEKEVLQFIGDIRN